MSSQSEAMECKEELGDHFWILSPCVSREHARGSFWAEPIRAVTGNGGDSFGIGNMPGNGNCIRSEHGGSSQPARVEKEGRKEGKEGIMTRQLAPSVYSLSVCLEGEGCTIVGCSSDGPSKKSHFQRMPACLLRTVSPWQCRRWG